MSGVPQLRYAESAFPPRCVPAPAPEHAMRGPGVRPVGSSLRRRLLVIILVIGVPAPLVDVAEPVVRPTRFGRFHPRLGHVPGISIAPGVLDEVRRIAPPRRIPTRPPSAAGSRLSSPERRTFPVDLVERPSALPSHSACCRTDRIEPGNAAPPDTDRWRDRQPCPCRRAWLKTSSGYGPSRPCTAPGSPR